MIQFILMDVEGTTTSIHFVHQVLFPYASTYLRPFILEHIEVQKVAEQLQVVQETVLKESGVSPTPKEAIDTLEAWIVADRKHTALKALQGYLWREGYQNGAFKGHIYEDVVPAWDQWKKRKFLLGIYSSGSVEAQQLLFRYSDKGDLTPYLEVHFDTRIGHKRIPDSYVAIQKELVLPGSAMLFLSDVEAELDAAASAGVRTCQVVREDTQAANNHPIVHSFSEIEDLLLG